MNYLAVKLKLFHVQNEKNLGEQFYAFNSFIATVLLKSLKYFSPWKVLGSRL